MNRLAERLANGAACGANGYTLRRDELRKEEAELAKITLSRDRSGGLAGLAVLIDGEKVGKVRPGNSLTHEVEPGAHEVRIRRMWVHVEANVEVGEDEAVELYCSEAEVFDDSAEVMAVKTLHALANHGGLRIWIADPPAGE